MKTSNKIFISFLIFLFSGISLLYLGSKYYTSYYDTSKWVSQEKPLPHFSVVVAETSAQIQLQNGSETKILQSAFKEAQPKFAPFIVRNDTLFVFPPKNDPNKFPKSHFLVSVFCNNVKHFVAKDRSYANFSNYKVDSVFVKMNNAELFCQNNNSNYIKIIAKNSRANFDCQKLNSMEVELDKTYLDVKSKNRVKNISGTLKNDSDVKLNLNAKVNLDVDRSSYLNVLVYNTQN
jgi:hypothetical protein